jgi:hypothetical protein
MRLLASAARKPFNSDHFLAARQNETKQKREF